MAPTARPSARDAVDALALINACRRGDAEAIDRVLNSANAHAVARALANAIPRAVRATGGVDDFVRGLADRALDHETAAAPSVPPAVPVAAAVADHLRALLGDVEAGALPAEQWQVGWLAGAISTLTLAGGGVSNRSL